jgi:hypothetical protein
MKSMSVKFCSMVSRVLIVVNSSSFFFCVIFVFFFNFVFAWGVFVC